MIPVDKNARTRLTAVALAALVSFGGLSTLAAPAHADGVLASIVPRVLIGNGEDNNNYQHAYRTDDHSRSRNQEHHHRYYKREGDNRRGDNRDQGYSQRGD
jgi:hypothetical protein